jgi:hypothetical protein
MAEPEAPTAEPTIDVPLAAAGTKARQRRKEKLAETEVSVRCSLSGSHLTD